MFIVYTSNEEVLITTKKREKRMLEVFFEIDTGRDIDDYDREEVNDDVVWIGHSFSIA